VQLEQLELVVVAQQALGDERRARVDPERVALVEPADQVHIGLQGGGEGRGLGREQADHAVCRFAAGVGVVAIEPVQPGAGMGVQHGQGRVFFDKVLQGGDQDRVLEHVGMIACMEGVAITEHVQW
jgi:hypothetical protein